ncbi:helix-turn-helix transcriptional regulator [Streptomyces sp. NPDC012510]|uniref:helix-turn-helix transcriptional regulator n=1 Tax=Streptomyces sp. NPDC012510 TaxID=3364838 RepID=UPI0036E7CAD6
MAELLDNVQKLGKDVAVPENPESEGSRLITLKQIELEHGVSRSALHTYRRSTSFPQPVPVEGSTKTHYRADEVAAWFQANPKQQGKKRDQFVSHQQGDPVSTTVDPRIAVLSDLSSPSWHPVPEAYGMPWSEAEKLLDAYRAAVLRDFLWRLEQSSGDQVAAKLVEDNPDLAELLNATETEAS